MRQLPTFLPVLAIATLRLAAPADAAPVITTATSGPNTPSTTTDEITYAGDVSGTDLLHGIVGTGGIWLGNGSSPAGLNDADPGGDFDDEGLSALGGAAWSSDGDGVSFRQFELGTGAGDGFDITEIQSIAAWQGAGFSNQKYEVRVRLVGEADFPVDPLLTVDYQPFTAALNEGGSTKVNVTDDTGVLASGVEAIRFTILDTTSNNGGGAVIREIDVFGAESDPDTSPPVISTLDPADDATGVLTTTNLVAAFDEPVTPGTGNVTIRNLTDASNTVIAIDDTTQVSFVDRSVTIDPVADLLAGKDYAVQIDVGAIFDTTTNSFPGIGDTTTWNFSTDGTAPMSSSMGPTAGAKDVLSNADLTLLFDEDVQAGTGNITIHLASDNSVVETIDAASGSVMIDGAEVTIDIGDLLTSTAYYVNISAGAFEDLSGNGFAGILDTTTWAFTTGRFLVTTVMSGPNSPSTTDDELTYAGDVSSTDLLHGIAGTGGVWQAGGGSPDGLNDANPGGDFDDVGNPAALNGAAWARDGDGVSFREFELGAGSGAGFDITEIQSIAAWQGAGFSNQKYEVRVRLVGEAGFPAEPLLTVDYQPFPDLPLNNGGSTKVNITADTGLVASGVEAIRFDVLDTVSNNVGGAVFREIDVFGSETGGGLVLTIAENGGLLDFAWNSKSGMQYDLVTSVDLATPVTTWPVYDDGVMTYENLPATGMSTTQTGVMKNGTKRFFAVIEEEIPPLFEEDFESADGGFTVATSAGTDWEHGAPDSSGLGGTVNTGNGGSVNAWGTNLGDASGPTGNIGLYADSTITCLRSAVIDLTGVAGAELMFAEALDLEQDTIAPDDIAVVNIIDDTTDTVIAAAIYTATDGDTNAAAWASAGPITIPAAALGQPVRIEWCVNGFGGDSDDYLGWYIDDVVVTETFP